MAEIEFITLCDSAQSIAGKLYLLGAGWAVMQRIRWEDAPDESPQANQFAVAASISVDWNEAASNIPVRVSIEGPDGKEILVAEANFTAFTIGEQQPHPLRANLAIPVTMVFPAPGSYRAVIRLPGQNHERASKFAVSDMPVLRGAKAPS